MQFNKDLMFRVIRIIFVFLAICFTTHSYTSTFEINEKHNMEAKFSIQHKNAHHCDMSQHVVGMFEQIAEKHCNKSFCCLVIMLDLMHSLFDQVMDYNSSSHFNYSDLLTIGIHHVPYRPPSV